MHHHRQWVTLSHFFFAQGHKEEQVVASTGHQSGKLAVAIENPQPFTLHRPRHQCPVSFIECIALRGSILAKEVFWQRARQLRFEARTQLAVDSSSFFRLIISTNQQNTFSFGPFQSLSNP
jgi:hypothetical protein